MRSALLSSITVLFGMSSACHNPAPNDVSRNPARVRIVAPDAGDLAVAVVSRFGEVEWSCDEAIVERRTAGSPWRHWESGDLPPPPVGSGAETQGVHEWDAGKACAFVDANHAWVAALAGSWPHRHVVVFRTEDGGAHWVAAGLGNDRYTDWPVEPSARLKFRDELHGKLETLDPPQHHNGHLETRIIYITRDGGVQWTLQREETRCFDQANHCQGG